MSIDKVLNTSYNRLKKSRKALNQSVTFKEEKKMKKIFAAAALAAIILTNGTAAAYESRGNQCGEHPEHLTGLPAVVESVNMARAGVIDWQDLPEFIAADFELYRLAGEIRAWMYAHEIAAGPTEDANPFRKD